MWMHANRELWNLRGNNAHGLNRSSKTGHHRHNDADAEVKLKVDAVSRAHGERVTFSSCRLEISDQVS